MLFINDKCWILLLSGLCLTRAFNVYVVPDQENLDESTEFPTEEAETSTEDLSDFKDVTVESGEYTTYIYQYENEQNMGLNDPKERCFDDYTKCLTSLISGVTPICGYHSEYDGVRNIRTFRNICDMYLDNCIKGHRHYRFVAFGRCIKIFNECGRGNYKTCPWYWQSFGVDNTK